MTVTKRKPKPITAHPMFPVVTALWFAAFLSLGSFAVAPALLEGPVVALGIPDILPAAQPPLGFTVRALVAIVMMGVGGLLGLMIGRRLARGNVVTPVRARSFGRTEAKAATPARQPQHRPPLNPIEDLGEPFADDVSAPPSVFAATPVVDLPPVEEGETEIVEVARLPWEQEHADTPARAAAPMREVFVDDPLALDLLFEDAEYESAEYESEAAAASQVFVPHSPASVSFAADATVDAFAKEPAAPVSGPVSRPDAAIEDDIIDDDTPASARAQSFVPPSMPLIKAPLLQAPIPAPTPLARTPLEELGLVQLTERLALAIGRRNARAETAPQGPASAAPYAVPTSQTFAPAAAPDREAAQAEPFPFGAPPQVPAPQVPAPQAPVPQAPVIARFPSSVPSDDAEEAKQPPEAERVVQLRPAALQPFVPEAYAFDDEDVPGLDRFLRVPTPPAVAGPVEAPGDFDSADFDGDDFDGDDFGGDEFEAAEFDDSEDEDEVAAGVVCDRDVAVADDGEADIEVPEDRYPSLLDMGVGANRLAALQLSQDEDEDEEGHADEDAEPIVVFPGQTSALPAMQRPFERPSALAGGSELPASIIPVPGSPLAIPGRAAPSSPLDFLTDPSSPVATTIVEAEEADRALRAALATLQRMTAQG